MDVKNPSLVSFVFVIFLLQIASNVKKKFRCLGSFTSNVKETFFQNLYSFIRENDIIYSSTNLSIERRTL